MIGIDPNPEWSVMDYFEKRVAAETSARQFIAARSEGRYERRSASIRSKKEVHRSVVQEKFACLTYHAIGDAADQYTVSEQELGNHLSLLARKGSWSKASSN